MEIEKNNKIEIKNELVNEKSQKNFLESTLGKTINTAIDIGIRALLPDFIDEQVINIKNNFLHNTFLHIPNNIIRIPFTNLIHHAIFLKQYLFLNIYS